MSLNPTQIPKTVGSSYRPEIDGLRALAVLAVIINHFNADLLPTGFLGVDIFFVISGFVVTSSLANKPDQSWKNYILNFYSRRVKRLIPALATCVVLTSIIGCLFIYKPGTYLWTGITSLVGLSNLFLLQRATDYFGQSAELNLFTQTWSLGVEEQFYLLFPILLGLCGFSRKQRRQGKQTLFFVVLSLSLISFINYIHLYHTNPAAAFFLMPARFWELGAGCLTFLVVNRLANHAFDLWKRAIAPLTLLLLIAIFFLNKDLQFLTTIATTGLTCLLIAALDSRSFVVKFLSLKWIVHIGLLSYSLYLWHWSIIVISRWTIGVSRYTIPIQILLILGLASASYYGIEKPLRHLQWSISKFRTIGYGLTASLLSMGLLVTLGKPLEGKLYTGNLVAIQEVFRAFDQPSIADTSISRKNCHFTAQGEVNITELVTLCSAQGDSNLPKIYLYGDSHADMLKHLLGRLHFENQLSIETITGSATPFPFLNYSSTIVDPTVAEKATLALEKHLAESVVPEDIVVIGTYWLQYFHPTEENSNIEPLESWLIKVSNLADMLSSKQASLVLISPLPRFEFPWHLGFEPAICTPEWFRPQLPTACTQVLADKAFLIQQRQPILEGLNTLAGDSKNLLIYDPFEVLCPDANQCYPYLNGKFIYKDDDHLSNFGAAYLYDHFLEFLRQSELL